MKRRNYFIFALLVSGLSLSLFGCGEKEKVTPESLLTKLNENVSEKESMEMEMEMVLDATVGIGEEGSAMSMDMNMKMNSESEAIRDSASHTVSTVSASILGQEMEEKAESYTIPEDGKTKVYTLSNDSWYVETAEAEESVDAAEEMDELLDMISDGSMKAELGEETEKVNGKDSYVLTLTLDTEGLKDIMSMSGESSDALPDLGDLDDLDFKLPFTFYIDKEELLPVRFELDLSSMDSLLAEVLKESSGGMEMTLTMDEFSLSCDIKGYDTVDAINLPAEAKEADELGSSDDLDLNLGGLGDLDDAGDTDTPDTDTDDEEEIPVDANGNYYFSDYDGNIGTLAPIDGLKIRYASDSFLGFEYKGMSGSLMLYPYTTSEEYLEDFRDLSYFEEDSSYSELTAGEPETKNLGGKELTYCMNTYKFEDVPCKDYTYWMTISDEMLLVMEMDEMLFEGDTSVVNDEAVGELWAAITPPTLP